MRSFMSMRRGNTSRVAIIAGFIMLFIVLSFLPAFAPRAHAGAVPMKNYCVVPPYVKTDIEPNLMLLLDNSYINRSWAYGEETPNTGDNYYVGWQVVANDERYEGYFKPEIKYSWVSAGSLFVPDNGTTMDPDSDGEPGVFDGNMLAWATTSRLDLIMAVLLDGSGVPTVNVAKLGSENGSWRKSDGTEQIAWPEKRYRYRDDAAVLHECILTVNEGDRGLLTIRPSGANPCGLLSDPPVGPRDSYSYATADASLPGSDPSGPVMYAGALAPLASEDIVDTEKLKEITAQATQFVNRLIGAFSPDLAYAGPALKIKTPDRKGQPYDWSGGENTLLIPSEDLYSYEFDIAYTNGVAFQYLLEATGGSPYDESIQGPYDWTTHKPYPANTRGDYQYNDYLNPISGDYETFLDATLYYEDGLNGEFWLTVHAEDSSGEDEYGLLHFINTVVEPDPTAVQTFKVQVCAGDYATNCDSSTPDYIKQGLLQEYWSRARFGYADFKSQVTNPSVSYCIEDSLDNDGNIPDTMPNAFGNQAQNASALGAFDTFTYLVDGLHETILSFMGENSAPLCDPFKDDETKCRNNFILMLTSAEGADLKTGSDQVFSPLASPDCTGAVSDLAKNACYGYTTDLRSDTVGVDEQDGIQKVATYIVDAMSNNPTNSEILQEAARFGGGNYYGVEDPRSLREDLKQAFEDIIKRAASGTAASVLASGEGSGANLIQAIYYPRRKFLDSAAGSYDEIAWIGRLTNFWYYVDPYFANSNIREEIFDPSSESVPTLDLKDDPIIEMYFDAASEIVKADRWQDIDGDGEPDVDLDEDDPAFESLGNIWEAGMKLWNTPAGQRKIYVADLVSGSIGTTDLIQFTNSTTFIQDSDIQSAIQASGDDEARSIIEFVMGYQTDACDLDDITACRTRLVKVDINGDGDTLDTAAAPFVGSPDSYDETVAKVWKLGDVLNSTPRLAATLANHRYDTVYSDATYAQYVESDVYQNRGLAIAGSNAGMLHAFRLGKLEFDWAGRNTWEHGRLLGNDLGKEEWAFIPTDALPYLRYQMYPGYCHVYLVDLSSYILDLSPIDVATGNADPTAVKTVDSWRTIVIGGMRFGGACNDASDSCTKDLNLDGVVDEKDCVKSPVDDIGFSSYFALDITNTTEPPKLLWEFTNDDLGFSTTGPAIVRQAAWTTDMSNNPIRDKYANGYWYVVVGSGPTGPIDQDVAQFLGRSDQNLKFFIFDAWKGPDAGLTEIDTGISEAFASSMFNIALDVQLGASEMQDYSDDALYIGYAKRCTSTRTSDPECEEDRWNDGGIGRILTFGEINPSNWEWSVLVDGIGPVTAATAKAVDPIKDEVWVLAATGRYSYVKPDYSLVNAPSMPDDYNSTRHIVGFLDPCFVDTTSGYKASCVGETIDTNNLLDVTDVNNVQNDLAGLNYDGWFIALDNAVAVDGYASERVITDLVATNNGVLFVTSFKPYTDECSIGGKAHLWAVMLDTGGATGTLLKGTAVMQVSTGAIEKIDLSEAFVQRGGRRSEMIEGKPPISQGMSIAQTPPPVDRVLHFIERDY